MPEIMIEGQTIEKIPDRLTLETALSLLANNPFPSRLEIRRALVGNRAVRIAPNGFEAGWNQVTFTKTGMEILGVGENERVWQHHFDEVTELPEGSELFATNPHSRIQTYINYDQGILGTQFHPEIDRETGNEIFLKDRELLVKNRYDVDEMIKQGPSFKTGNVFFGFSWRSLICATPPNS